jgi:hypothetical protein
MKSRLLTIVLFLSLAVNAGVLGAMGYHYYHYASASPSAPCPLAPKDGYLYQSLSLSPSQLTQMEPLAQKFHKRLAELGGVMQQKKGLLVDSLQKDSSKENLDNLQKEMAGLQGEIQREVINHIMETKKILDTKQQEHFFALMHRSMTIAKVPWPPLNGGM